MRCFDNIDHKKFPTHKIIRNGEGCSIMPLSGYPIVILKAFPGDCGTLTMQGVNGASLKQLEIVKYVASITGYDTVIGTAVYVNRTEEEKEQLKKRYHKAGFKRAVVGKSNRKHSYDKHNLKIVYTLHIRNCLHKGY